MKLPSITFTRSGQSCFSFFENWTFFLANWIPQTGFLSNKTIANSLVYFDTLSLMQHDTLLALYSFPPITMHFPCLMIHLNKYKSIKNMIAIILQDLPFLADTVGKPLNLFDCYSFLISRKQMPNSFQSMKKLIVFGVTVTYILLIYYLICIILNLIFNILKFRLITDEAPP